MNVHRHLRRITSLALLVLGAASGLGAQDQSQPQTDVQSAYTMKVNSDLVLTNVVVRDKKTGQLVRGLKASDFQILENGKPQTIISFDFESVDQATPLNEATVNGKSPNNIMGSMNRNVTSEQLRNHRLIVMFFDITSMQPEDLDRAQEAARNYINNQMHAADLVAVVSLDQSLSLDQDFTANKKLLLNAVNAYSGTQEAGFQSGATSTTNQTEDTTAFTPDEQEYNDVNTDRELFAFEDIAHSLAYINEKKSVLYFSGGIQRDGIENQASLHAAINASVRANMSIYSVDARGLEAISPLGDASTGSLRGTSAYNGAGLQNNLDSNFNTQEVMATLSSDTGGKAFFDSNDFSPAFQRIQQDTSAYYVIGFRSTNPLRDGRYRRLSIRINRPDVKLEYRPGYYAPADYKHADKDERERQLQEELASDLPATDVEVYLQAYYFRSDTGNGQPRYYVPVSLIVPGSQIPFVKGGDRSKATLDIIGELKNTAGQDMAEIRQTVKLSIDDSQQVSRKNIQYTTGFTLPLGKYHLKFVVRENETGRMGSFETDINLPDLKKLPLKLSSVVLSSQRSPAGKKEEGNPLTNGGYTWVPNVAHVFRTDQHMYLLYEVYDPASAPPKAATPVSASVKPGVKVLTSIEFLQGTTKVFETPLVEANSVNSPARDAVAFAFDIPLDQLHAGLYICQVNVIDDTGGSFSFPRQALLIRAAAAPPPAVPNPTPSSAPPSNPPPAPRAPTP
ncbi:MAG TPA: VWA domain-containing protein [Acidobacteriaceae bacterium]|nr:VWA domain-containing protein [Acidobacteriaceae bacterium]